MLMRPIKKSPKPMTPAKRLYQNQFTSIYDLIPRPTLLSRTDRDFYPATEQIHWAHISPWHDHLGILMVNVRVMQGYEMVMPCQSMLRTFLDAKGSSRCHHMPQSAGEMSSLKRCCIDPPSSRFLIHKCVVEDGKDGEDVYRQP